MRYHKGKTFRSNPRLFRADKALYFPNLQGITLATPRQLCDTTQVLEDKVSVVSVFSEMWAERQTATFVGEKENQELRAVLKEGKGVAQMVDINYEPNAMKAALIRLFMPGLRRRVPTDAHGRYFVVRRGLTEEIRDDVGWINSKVGYVYLVDKECKIRWAGSGTAEAGETEGLVAGVKRLLEEYKKKPRAEVVEEGGDGNFPGLDVATEAVAVATGRQH